MVIDVDSLQQYGAGVGIPFGAGVAATTAAAVGVSGTLATVVGYGAAGGLVVGALAGRFAETTRPRENWRLRVAGFTLVVSLLVGSALGGLTAWIETAAVANGVLAGGAAGGVFGLLVSGVLVATGGE